MVEIIDENGYFLGRINVIDLLAVLLVIAIITAGAALVLGTGDEQQTESATIEIRAENVQPYVAEEIPTSGPVDGGNVISLENKSVTPATVLVSDQEGNLHERNHPRLQTVELEVTVQVTETEDGLQYNQRSISVGKQIGIDMGSVELRGNITRIGDTN